MAILKFDEIITYTIDGKDCCKECFSKLAKRGGLLFPLTEDDINEGDVVVCDNCGVQIAVVN